MPLLDFQAGYVAQRTAGKTVRDRLPVCYSGSAPSDPRVAVLRADGSVLLDYVSAPVASSGGLAGPSVPQGDGYRVALKDGATGTPQTGGNAWGVGVNILFQGQSNEGGMLYGDGGGGALPSDVEPRARWFDADGWRRLSDAFLTPTTHVIARETVRGLGGAVPVGLTRLTQDGSSISQHLPGPGGDVYARLFSASGTGAASGGGDAGFASPRWVWSGDFEAAHYYQGEGDAGNTEAYFYARLGDLEAAYVAAGSALGRTPETLFLTLTLIAGMWGATNVQGVRRAIQRRVAEWRAAGRPREVMGGLDLYSDGLHLNYPQHRVLGRRTAAVLRRVGTGNALDGRYGAISSMSRTGLQWRIKVDLAGATGLQARKGGSPSGFAVSGDNFAADKRLPAGVSITGADEVTVTLPSSFAGRVATVAYQEAVPNNGDRIAPTPSDWPDPNIPFDGSSYPDISNPLELIGKPIPASAPDYAGESAPTATPVLPTFVTVTLADGETWTAPAGATSAGAVAGGGTTAAPATPGKVTGLRLTSNSGGVIGYAFDSYVGTAAYRVEMRPRGGAVPSTDAWGGIDTLDASTTTGSKGGLVDATYYELRVLARDSSGAIIATSDTVPVTIGTPAPGNTGGGTSSGAATGPWADAGTLRLVGPGRTYGTIQAAVDAAVAGDTVVVDDGTYAGFRLSKAVLVRARNRLGATIDAKITGSFAIVDGKGAVLVTASGARLAGFRITNGTSGAVGSETNPVAGGEAGVRVDYGIARFDLDGCRFDNNANGLFSGGPNSIYESNCEYGASTPNGATRDFKTHDIYVTGETILFETRNSFHYGNPTGHDIKSRSKTTRVYGGLTRGKGIRNFDISDGGLVEISGAYITHDPANGQRDFLAVGPESLSNGASQDCKLTGGTLVCRQSNMRVSLQSGVKLTASGVSQVWVNDGNGAPSLDLNAQGGTITGLSASPGSATVLAAMPAAPTFQYDASLAPGIAYTPAASTGSGTGTSTGGATTGGSTTSPAPSTGGSGGGTSTTTTPSTGTNTTGAQVAYYTLEGKAVLDKASAKLLTSALSGGTGSTGGAPAPSTGTGGATGGTTGGGTTTGGSTTAPSTGGTGTTAPITTPKITNLRVTSISGTTVYYAWDAYPGAASYRAEARARDGANATDAWSGIATLDGSTTSESKGGLPDNTTYEFRVLARDSAGATLAVSDPLKVVLGTPASASTGTGTSTGGSGTGSTGGSAGGTTTMPPGVATGAFSATYPWHVLAGGTDVAVQRVFGNGPGEVPAGSKLTAAVDGTPVVLQDLATATWPDGSRRAGVVSLTLPGARAAGSTAQVVFGVTGGAPDATVSKSPAAIAADSDFELRLSGYDLGGDTFVLNVNSIIAANPVFPYGTNPSRMLRVFDAGPERTRLCAEGFVRRASDGAIHRTLKAFVYLDALKSGAYRAIVRWVQDTTYGAFAGGTVGPSGPTRINFVAELFNKGVRIGAWGGPNDPRARSGDGATMLNNGRFIAPAGFNCGYDCGVGVAFSGGNLGGLDGNRVYFPRWSDRGFALDVTRRADNYPSFGTGSGTVTVFPVMHSFVASGGIGTGLDLHPVWVGPGNKPVVQPGHDRAHLMQRSRMVPPYQTGLQQGKVGGTPRVHTPGEVTMLEVWAISSASDNPGNPRLGWMGYTHSRIMFTPDDPVLWADMMSQAVSWADFPQQLTDERSGMPPVVNNGPNGDGVTYPGFAPVNPELENILNGGGAGAPKLGAAQMAGWNKSSEYSHGYDDDYQLTNSFAHTPNWWFMPYVLTGDEVWRDLGRANAASAGMLWNHSHGAEGVTYRPIINSQARGIAWGLRDMSNYVHVSPDNDPYRRVVQDYLKANYRYYAAQSRVGHGRHLGKVYIGYERTSDFGGRPFQDYMFAFALGMLYWRTGDADLRAIMDCFAQYIVRTYDDQYIAGAGWLSNEYGIHANDWDNTTGRGAGLVYDNTAQMLQYSQEPAFDIPQAGPAPYPATGLRRSGNDFSNAEYNYNANSYVAMLLAAQAIWASCGISGPGRVRKQILQRIYGTVKEIPVNSRADGLVPQYALTPLPGSPD